MFFGFSIWSSESIFENENYAVLSFPSHLCRSTVAALKIGSYWRSLEPTFNASSRENVKCSHTTDACSDIHSFVWRSPTPRTSIFEKWNGSPNLSKIVYLALIKFVFFAWSTDRRYLNTTSFIHTSTPLSQYSPHRAALDETFASRLLLSTSYCKGEALLSQKQTRTHRDHTELVQNPNMESFDHNCPTGPSLDNKKTIEKYLFTPYLRPAYVLSRHSPHPGKHKWIQLVI